MENTQKKQPYQPPTITRVVLRREQAILSQCSSTWTGLQATNLNWCRSTNGCRQAKGSAGADSSGNPS